MRIEVNAKCSRRYEYRTGGGRLVWKIANSKFAILPGWSNRGNVVLEVLAEVSGMSLSCGNIVRLTAPGPDTSCLSSTSQCSYIPFGENLKSSSLSASFKASVNKQKARTDLGSTFRKISSFHRWTHDVTMHENVQVNADSGTPWNLNNEIEWLT